jgi:hypothetical protein
MKNISVLLILVLVIGLVAGCSPAAETDDNVEPEETDIVTTASVTDDKGVFKAAMAADGTWIIAALTDFTFDEALVLEGTIDHDGTEERKIALYEQDEDRNITGEFTLKTPSLTIKTDNTRIKGGTIDGDLYVQANNFQLQHVVVTGDVIFANEDVKASFAADEDSTIEGGTSYNNYYSNDFYYNKNYNFKFIYPENWKNKVLVEETKYHDIIEITFYYTGYKTPIDTYQPFFSIRVIEKDGHENFKPEQSIIIKKNNDYTMIIFKDLDNGLAGAKAIEEYIQLQIPNKEIIKRIEFKKEKE